MSLAIRELFVGLERVMFFIYKVRLCVLMGKLQTNCVGQILMYLKYVSICLPFINDTTSLIKVKGKR